MFIRVTQVKVASGRWDEFLETFEKTTIPQLEAMPGFMRIICTGDGDAGESNLITMWGSADNGGGSGTGGVDAAIGSLSEFLEGQPTTSGYKELIEREF